MVVTFDTHGTSHPVLPEEILGTKSICDSSVHFKLLRESVIKKMIGKFVPLLVFFLAVSTSSALKFKVDGNDEGSAKVETLIDNEEVFIPSNGAFTLYIDM